MYKRFLCCMEASVILKLGVDFIFFSDAMKVYLRFACDVFCA